MYQHYPSFRWEIIQNVHMFFFSSPSDSIVLLLCYTFIPLSVQALGQKHGVSWAEGEPGALWVRYFSFAKFRFPARNKNQTTSDDGLVPGHFPASHQPESYFRSCQRSCSLCLFGLRWALLFLLAALVSYVRLLKALLKNSSQNPSSPWLGEGILIIPDTRFREET